MVHLLFAVLAASAAPELPVAQKLYAEGRFEEVERIYRRLLEREQFNAREYPIILNGLGGALFERGRPGEAEPFLRRAIEVWRKNGADSAPQLAIALSNLGAALRTLGRIPEAESSYLEAIALLRTHGEKRRLAPMLTNLAILYGSDRARLLDAETLHREALAIREREDVASPAGRHALGNSYAAFAQFLLANHRFVEAESLFKKALELHEGSLPAGHPQLARDRGNLALLYRTTIRLGAAETLYREALDEFERIAWTRHPDYAATLNNLAHARAASGDHKTAESLYRQAISLWEELLGPDHPSVAAGVSNLAGSLRKQGRFAEAPPLLRRALRIDETRLGPEHPRTLADLEEMGEFHLERRDYALAETFLNKALTARDRLHGAGSPEVAMVRAALAEVYRCTKRGATAVTAFREAVEVLGKHWASDDVRWPPILANFEMALRSQAAFADAERIAVWLVRIQVRRAIAAQRAAASDATPR
jgi:tetratricopeptide (TPR) repeat protein